LRCVGWFGGADCGHDRGGPARAAAQVGQYDPAMSAVTTLGHQGNVRPSGAVAAQGQARFPGRTAGKPCLTLSGSASSGVPAGVVGAALACTLDLPRVVRDIDGYTEVDVDLLYATAEWFRQNSAAGLIPRQVPILGLHAKWLNTHHAARCGARGLWPTASRQVAPLRALTPPKPGSGRWRLPPRGLRCAGVELRVR
jgi:hypothetical protein